MYEELRPPVTQRITQEKPGQTLQATALVHEGCIRLVEGFQGRNCNSRGHFVAAWSALPRDEQFAQIVAVRQTRSLPVLEKIKQWLDTEQQIVLPRSSMAAAITYAQNHWAALTMYVTRGFLNIDNNAGERALKRVAIGRKNWLFAGNDAAAENHARLWSLIASAERHTIDPQRYLISVLAKLPLLAPDDAEALVQFLPDVCKREDAAEPTPSK